MTVASKPVQAREALWLELLIMEVDKAEATISARVCINAGCRRHLECCMILPQAFESSATRNLRNKRSQWLTVDRCSRLGGGSSRAAGQMWGGATLEDQQSRYDRSWSFWMERVAKQRSRPLIHRLNITLASDLWRAGYVSASSLPTHKEGLEFYSGLITWRAQNRRSGSI